MTAAARVLLVIVVGGTLLMAATVATAAVALYGAGTIAVTVEEDRGDRFSVRVPAGLANLVLNLIPGRLVDEALRDVSDEIDPFVPSVRDAWAQLNATGDFVLVEVNEGDEHVLVRKVDDKLVITVDTNDTDIDIAVPMKTIGKVIHKL